MTDENIEAKKSEIAKKEEAILKFWQENKIFEKTLTKEAPKGEFVFYDGPVTANSKPVLHTMVPFAFKDVVPRYKTMQGFQVKRKGGWDTHGLPIENALTKKKKVNRKAMPTADFRELCKKYALEQVQIQKQQFKRNLKSYGIQNFYVDYDKDAYSYFGEWDGYDYLYLLSINRWVVNELTSLFGDKWIPVFKRWFEYNSGLEVRKIDLKNRYLHL